MRARSRWGLLAVLALAVGARGPSLPAQTVEFRRGTRGLPAADEALLRVLERGSYRVFTTDAVIGRNQVLRSDVVVLGSSLRVEGRIAGDLVGVDADLFARPGSRIEGVVAVLGGGFYGSSLARLRAPPIDASRLDYRVVGADAQEYVVAGPGGRNHLRLAGVYGFLLPEYDRVNALTVVWGADLEGGASEWVPDARGRVRFRSARTDVDGELDLTWPLGRHSVGLRGGVGVRSHDRWISDDVANSLQAVIGARDTRLYYEARFAELVGRLTLGTFVRWSPELSLGWEQARALDNRDPFSLFSVRGGFRNNSPVAEADAVSARAATTLDSQEPGGSRFHVEGSVERADATVAGDLTFTVVAAAGLIEIPTLADQRVILETRTQFPSSSGAPPQRWRALGGWGSLPTLRPVARRGDRMWWLALTYRWPLGRVGPPLGRLSAWLQYAGGNAWSDPELRPPTVHNVGAGISLGWLAVAVYTDPSDDFETVLTLGFDRYR